jgi:acetyl esterase
MPRSDLEPLFNLIRSAPQAQSIAEQRRQLEAFTPFVNANPPAVGRIEVGVPLSPEVHADVIVPPGDPPFPTLIYLHGGGWSIGSPASHAKLARQLCAGGGVVVVNVDYRLAPEHPFPTPLDDCVAAARWTRARVASYGGDPERIAIGGDSAGANLSAAVINDLRHEIDFRAALLIYGAFDLAGSLANYDQYAPEGDPLLPKSLMRLMQNAYLRGGTSPEDPRVSPLNADLRHFPSSCLIVGDDDPLLGDSLALSDKLRALGRECALHRYAGMPHAFAQLDVSEAQAAIRIASAFLAHHLSA